MKFFQRFLVCLFLFSVLVCPAFAQPVIQASYLMPSDQNVPYQHEVDALLESLTDIQSFYASEMKRLGFAPKTFQFEKEIPIYLGTKKLSEYKSVHDVRSNIPRTKSYHIQLVFLIGSKSFLNAAGVQSPPCNVESVCTDRLTIVALDWADREFLEPITAHELAHAFGFDRHVESDGRYLMDLSPKFFGGRGEIENFEFSLETARTLDKSDTLSIIDDINTDTSDEDESVQTDTIDADVNDDGYVDLYDVMIVRSGMQNSTSYDTDLNNDGITDEVDLLIVKAKAMEAIAAAAPRKRKVKITTWGRLKRE